MLLDDLKTRVGEWLRCQGPESDIVVSTRLRLARNIQGYQFLTHATLELKEEIETVIRSKLLDNKVVGGLVYVSLSDLSELDRTFLVERHLTSKEHSDGTGERGIALNQEETVSIMVNEEDHLRTQVFRSGLDLSAAWEHIREIDARMEEKLPFAFSPRFGYLSACPTNVGTGLRASVMLHLPALVLTKQIEKVFRAVTKINLAVRGLYGEGTQGIGNFYQISNQATLGRSEEELIDNLSSVVPQIIRYERKARKSLLADEEKRLEDKVWRSLGILRYARRISSAEALDLLSYLRLGLNLEIIQAPPLERINEMVLFSQPAHLQKLLDKDLPPAERDVARADFLREQLNGN